MTLPLENDGSPAAAQGLPPQACWRINSARRRPLAPTERAIDSLADLWASRELAWRLLVRDLSAKYRQSLLGYAWAFLPPLMLALSFTLAGQAGIINARSGDVPYTLFTLVGTVLWQTFSEAIHAPIRAVNEAKSLLARIRFPYESLVFAKLGEVVFNLTVRLGLVAVFMAAYGVDLSFWILLAPLAMGALILLGLAIGMFAAPLAGIYDDVGFAITLILSVWFFFTPIMYDQAAPGSIVSLINTANPVSHLLIAARSFLLLGEPPAAAGPLVVTAVTLPLLVLSWLAFRTSLVFAVERVSS
jgi:lipopolysaccharide transport system permease protein